MNEYQSLSHTKWECKYHVVFIPKSRRKVLYGQLRSDLGEVFRELARQKERRIEEGHLQPDHVHMLLSIPPKYAVAQVVGYLKGKSAIHIARTYGGRLAEFCGGTLLGAGVLCVDGRARRGGRAPVHSGAGGGGPTVGAIGVVQQEEVSALLEGSGFDRPSHLGWLMKV